jgi:hypothetical protein
MKVSLPVFFKLGVLGSALLFLLIPVLVSADENFQEEKPSAPAPVAEQTFDQDKALAELRKSIAGQENKPAAQVFKNIQLMKEMPAGRLLRVMEMGYSRSLGVKCTHCHVAGQWEKDDKPTKQIARDMMTMVAAINNEQLKKIKNLKSQPPVINCTTCHRGEIKPALNLPENKPQ